MHSLFQIRPWMKNVKFCALFTNTFLARTWSMYRLLRIFRSVAATMLLAVLLHLLIFHLLTANDAPLRKDMEYHIKYIDTCPDVGYFFERESTANALEPQICHLCFCQGDNTAVCWKRDNRRCSKESFHYHGVGKRNTRIKRSPAFTDIFFRDASRDYFNVNLKPQCKPYESSFSDDCPPADWCVGCTVCDCDANGRWDCHLLSFCPDDKKKNKSKRPSPPGSVPPPPGGWPLPPGAWPPFMANKPIKVNKTSSVRPPKKKTIPVKKYKISEKAKTKATHQIKRQSNKKQTTPKRIAKKKVPLKSGMTPEPGKMRTPIKYTKPSKQNSTKLIKKNIGTHKPIKINSSKVNLEKELAHKMVKKIMQSLKKSVSAQATSMSEIAKQHGNEIRNLKAKAKLNQLVNKQKGKKNVHKRQIKRKSSQKMSKTPMKKPIYRAKGKTTRKPYARKFVRNRRDVSMPDRADRAKGKTNRKPYARKFVRNRRDVSMPGATSVPISGTQGSPAESINTTVPVTVMPVLNNSLVPDNDNVLYTYMARSTQPENKYFRYSVGSEKPTAKMNGNKEDTASPQYNITETVFNLIGEQLNFNASAETTTEHIINTEANKSINFTEMNPKENTLKHSIWPNFKILMEKKVLPESDIKHNKRLLKWWSQHTNKTIILEDKNRNFGKKAKKLLNYRKYNMAKLLNHSKIKFDNSKMNGSNIQMSTKNEGYMHNFLTKIFNHSYKNSTTYLPKRKRRPSVLKYLKGIFNRIFKGSKKSDHLSKFQLIRTLCKNFGPCKVNRKDKALLNSKLTDLDRETRIILKTVRIIKGLLKLLELPESVNYNITKEGKFQNDIQKLNIVLKGKSKNEQMSLTDTQRTQIEYIKRSTQDFINSVNKFALLLNEIIAILTKEKYHRIKVGGKDHFMNKLKDPFQSLRVLLLRYNLIQNKFMKHMYEQLNHFEKEMNEKPKVSEVKDLNNTVEIETVSRNIIQNLRKLKRLAQTVSYSGRTKRAAARDDDTIEYLLMLMEYLVKQNHPLDAEPANDGIDLLIEAIKSAPDIKPIRKKVLEDASLFFTHSTTTTTPRTVMSETSLTKEENTQEFEKFSGDDSDKSNLEATEIKLNENKDLIEIVADDEKEFEDKQFDRRAESGKTDENAEMSSFSKFENNMIPEQENEFEASTFKSNTALETEISDKLESQDDTTTEKVLENDLDNPIEQSEGGSEKKIEVFTGDTDDDIISSSTITVIESDLYTTMDPELFPTRAMRYRSKMQISSQDPVIDGGVDSKSKLKWIEENFGKGAERVVVDFDDNNSTVDSTVHSMVDSTVVTPVTTTPEPEKSTTKDVSISTKEKDDDSGSKKDADKLSAEEIMFRKQMELLNSLDYGTERQEADEVESKDSNVEERYTGDSFPAYFV